MLTCVVYFCEAILVDLERKIRTLCNVANANKGHRRDMRYSAPNKRVSQYGVSLDISPKCLGRDDVLSSR